MKMSVVCLALAVAGCGGGDDPQESIDALEAAARASAEEGCADHNGVGKLIRQEVRMRPDGSIRSLSIFCQCKDGTLFWTPRT